MTTGRYGVGAGDRVGRGGWVGRLAATALIVSLATPTALAASSAAATEAPTVVSQPTGAQPWRVTCPAAATLLARGRSTEPWVEVTRLSLLHGSTDLSPAIVTRPCGSATVYEIQQVRVVSPTLFVPVNDRTRRSPPFVFAGVYLGDRLASQDVTVEIVIGPHGEPGPTTTLRRRVITLDASLAEGSGLGRGQRIEEAAASTAIPADTLEIQAVVQARDDGAYVLDRQPDDFRVKAGPTLATLDAEVTRDERTGLPVRDPATGRFLSTLPFFSPAQPATQRPSLRFLVMLDLGSWLEGDAPPVLPARYETFIDTAVLAGLRTTAMQLREAAGRYPPVELVLIRYGTGVQLFSTPIHLNAGLTDSEVGAIRAFLLRPPDPEWRAGESNLQRALDSTRALWHFHKGKRGAIAITSRRAHVEQAQPARTFPPSVFETEAVTRARYDTVLTAIRNGVPLVATLSLEHLQRRWPILYALGLPRNGIDYAPLARETELHGGFTVPIREPDRRAVAIVNVEDAVPFGTGLKRIIDDLDRAYLFRVRVKNRAQTRQVFRARVSLSDSSLQVRAQQLYVASPDRCTLMPSYLSTRLDDALRLAAAATASDCWENGDVVTALTTRLLGAGRESLAEIQDELLRSYGAILLRRVQALGGKRRKRAVEQLLTLDMGQLDRAVASRHGAQVASWQRLAMALGHR